MILMIMQLVKDTNLPMINILTLDGLINENGTNEYEGLERFEVRKKIVSDLEKQISIK